MKIEFIKEPNPESLEAGDSFEVGKVYDLKQDSAKRWISRGVAEEVKGLAKLTKKAE